MSLSKSEARAGPTIVLSDGGNSDTQHDAFALEEDDFMNQKPKLKTGADDVAVKTMSPKELLNLPSDSSPEITYSGDSSPGMEATELNETNSNSSNRKRTYPMRKEQLPILARLKVHPPGKEDSVVR